MSDDILEKSRDVKAEKAEEKRRLALEISSIFYQDGYVNRSSRRGP